MTTRDKKLLCILPFSIPGFLYVLYRNHQHPEDWKWWLAGMAILIALGAVAKLLPIFFRSRDCQTCKNWNPKPDQDIGECRRHSPIDSKWPTTRAEMSCGDYQSKSGFTLIELLTVIAIMGVMAALLAPVLTHFRKGDTTIAATRQMLDDVGRARQLAISQRSTVYMVFVSTNFWLDPLRNVINPNQWNRFATMCPNIASSMTVTQLYNAQLTGYAMFGTRSVGDQPGASHPRDLLRVRTLPIDSFIDPLKFQPPPATPTTPPLMFIQTNYPIYGFLRTNNIPFPTVDALTNAAYASQIANNIIQFPTVAYIAFNYLGQLTPGDGSLMPYDEYIPLSHGSVLYSKINGQTPPSTTENPPGNTTNISYNIIHIDRYTGRARLERTEIQ